MANEAILKEVEILQHVATRLLGLANEHIPISVELLAISESVRSAAVLLAVVVATKGAA
jgi:hypothetical protein